MLRMKKGLAALAAACFLFVGTGKAQAVIGIPDDVPGSTLLFPFFRVNPDRTANNALDTLIVITNTENRDQNVHVTIWTHDSQHVFDFPIQLTPHDVFSCSLYDIIVGSGCTSEGISPAPPSVAAALEFNNELAGYVTADLVTGQTLLDPVENNFTYPFGNRNSLVGYEYIVNLPAGSSTGMNAVSIESLFPQGGHPVGGIANTPVANSLQFGSHGFYNDSFTATTPPCVPTDFGTTPITLGNTQRDCLERIDGYNGLLTQTGATSDADSWDLIVRYFTASALNLRTGLWLWKESVSNINPTVSVYDEEENGVSVRLLLPDEVNFVDVNDIVTPGVNGGWFRVPLPSHEQSTAFSLQLANDQAATLRWDAIFPAHRQYTDFIGGDTAE